MSDFVVKLPWKYELSELLAAMLRAEQEYGWYDNQMSLCCKPIELKLPTKFQIHGTGVQRSKGKMRDDSHYNVFVPALNGTYFRHIWDDMNRRIPRGIFRMRITRIPPKGCLGFHYDYHLRYHVPIITNPHSFFLLDEGENFPNDTTDLRRGAFTAYHLPADGSVYKLHTLPWHTAMNMKEEYRYHLVMSGYA